MGAEFARQVHAQIKTKSDVKDNELWLIAFDRSGLDAIEKELGNDVALRTFDLDLSGTKGVERVKKLLDAEAAKNKFTIDLLINDAGFGTYGPFSETDVNREMAMVDLNCTALTGICGIALPYMKRGSRIINVASLAAFMPLGNFAVYAATKSYVLSFSMGLAAELKDSGIRVCALCPGSVSTNFANVASNGKRKLVWHGLDPRSVVAHCLKTSARGGHIAIWAFKWKLAAFLSRFVGRYAGARFTFLYHKRPH
jgi:hypothetical protein